MVEREHLRAASAVARVFRALSAAGAAGRAALPHDEESGPLLQPPVPLDVRAVRARHVSARPRADGEWRRRRGRGPCVRVRALSNRLDPASASVVVGLDAVRAVRSAAAFCDRPDTTARRRGRSLDRAEPVMRVLPALLQPHRALLHPLGAHDTPPLGRRAGAAVHGRRLRDGVCRDRAVRAAVSRAQAARLQSAIALRDRTLLRRRLRVLHRRSQPASLGTHRAGMAEGGRAAVSGRDDRRACGAWRHSIGGPERVALQDWIRGRHVERRATPSGSPVERRGSLSGSPRHADCRDDRLAAHRHPPARVFDSTAGPEDHRPLTRADHRRGRWRDPARGLARRTRFRHALALVPRRVLFADDALRRRDVLRARHPRKGKGRRSHQPVLGLLQLRARVRWPAGARSIRHDCHAWPRGTGRDRHRGDRPRPAAARQRTGRRVDCARGVGDSDPDQPELHGLHPGRARAAPGVGDDLPRTRRLSLHRHPCEVRGRHRAAARRAGVRHPLYVLLDHPLAPARERI